jgi:serine protease AprX
MDPKPLLLIVECTPDKEREKMISQLGSVKYRLPMINSYVIAVNDESCMSQLRNMPGIKAVHETAHITAQMNGVRKTVKADAARTMGVTGRGIGIAVLDTGVAPVDDLVLPVNRIAAFTDLINGRSEPYDDNGHGTHVAGIAAGNGYCSEGVYMGIAPESTIIAIKILDASGKGNSADVLAGIQWMLDNREKYNIRVANLSIGTEDRGERDPLIRAVNAAWDAGIVMTIAAGNNGPRVSSVTSPGVSRKVLTVGSSDDSDSVFIWGMTLENFSGRGPTSECIVKPDVVAPGAGVVSCLTPTPSLDKVENFDTKRVAEHYIQLSGTSMSAPIAAGAAALLLQKHPELTPDDVKYMFKQCASDLKYPKNQQGWGLIDVEKLLKGEAVHVRG